MHQQLSKRTNSRASSDQTQISLRCKHLTDRLNMIVYYQSLLLLMIYNQPLTFWLLKKDCMYKKCMQIKSLQGDQGKCL